MARTFIGMLTALIALTACAGAEEASSTSTTSAPPLTLPAGVDLAITEIVFGSEGAVILTNYGVDAVDLGGAWLGQGLSFVQFAPTVLGAGQSLVVSMGDDLDSGVSTDGYVDIGTAVGSLEYVAGEAALFRNGTFDDPGALISYVQWGAAEGRHAGTAGNAGLWDPPAFVQTGPDVSGLVAEAIPATTASNWSSR
jgi:hypothetical protein